MHIVVLTPEAKLYEGSISSLKAPGTIGEFEVLENHAPLVSSLTAGTVQLTFDKGNAKTFDIKQGFVEVLNNEISLLVQGPKEI